VKLLTLLLSLFVLTLSSVPCCALENSEADHPIHENSQNEDDCGQACSPFYTCGTCVGFTPHYPDELFADYLRPIQHHSIYPPFELPQTAGSIWQPPQLS
jgi:hypothetical protein